MPPGVVGEEAEIVLIGFQDVPARRVWRDQNRVAQAKAKAQYPLEDADQDERRRKGNHCTMTKLARQS
jgi:hypothetical protein